MRLYGLRLLVALLTFVVGVAAASLLSFSRSDSRPCGKRVLTYEPVAVSMGAREEAPPPPTRSCNVTLPGGMLDGEAVSKPRPVLPPAAKAANLKGTVIVRVHVGAADGKVFSAVAESGPMPLREAAEEAAYKATFSPTFVSGRPINVTGTLTYNFGL
jgi:outer membrane biosynthesis protein TonB